MSARMRHNVKQAITLANLTSVGICMVLCTMIGYFVGVWIDRHLPTAPVGLLTFLVLGIISGFVNIFRTIGEDNECSGTGRNDWNR